MNIFSFFSTKTYVVGTYHISLFRKDEKKNIDGVASPDGVFVSSKTVTVDSLFFIIIFQRKRGSTFHVNCQASFSLKNYEINKYLKMSSATVAIGTLRNNTYFTHKYKENYQPLVDKHLRNYPDSSMKHKIPNIASEHKCTLTLVMLNKSRCHAHF